MFDSHTGDLVLGPLEGHTKWVSSVVFSPDGAHIVSGSGDGTVQVWGVKDGSPICGPLEGHQGSVPSVAFSPDGAFIVSGSEDSTIRVWKAPRHAVESRPSEANSPSSGDREPHSAIARGLTISRDGWARNGDSQLLFWVPRNMVNIFPSVGTIYTIGQEGILKTDYSLPLYLGEEWHRCYLG
ncbi:unnamed protein product [Rhizoctonia solani]|uniref:Vegetative incompatibility protein HET-E-1 [Podospora anserina] n=1 Tax=Rhizoctonia solani TaxID=456999 RepID=A0A8H3GPD7_9AGAM|nr:unnamed protein product [Rhizoctonia solani]